MLKKAQNDKPRAPKCDMKIPKIAQKKDGKVTKNEKRSFEHLQNTGLKK